MKVNFEGTEYELDIEDIDLSDAMTIYRKTGMTVRALLEGLANVNPDAMRAIHWLMLKQNGRMTDMDKENFAVLKLAVAVNDAFVEDAKENPTEGTPGEVPVTA
jgi:hypothetical protein